MSNGIDGGAVREIRDLATQAKEVQQITLEDGRIFAGHSDNLREIYDPGADSWPVPLLVHSLSGVIDYLEWNPDELDLEKCVLQVQSPHRVVLASQVTGPARKRDRHLYLEAKAFAPGAGLFGDWRDIEEMVIALQAGTQDAHDRKRVLKLLGGVKDADEKEVRDDGVSQTVNVKSGASLVEAEKVPNPVTLAPFRTFPEIEEQPASPFVLRIRRGRGVGAALFEADGGAWQQEAIDEVKLWLEDQRDERVGDHPKVIG